MGPEGKNPFWSTRHRWKDNNKMDIKKSGMRVWTEKAKDKDQ
jgi:hypothetical protein